MSIAVLALIAPLLVAAPSGGAPPEVSSTEGAPAEREQLLVLSLEAQRVDPGLGSVVDTLVVQRASSEAAGYRVVTEKDLEQIVDLEAKRSAMGCDTVSCLGELAGALGARYILYGTLGRLGGTFVVQLHLFDSTLGRTIARADARSSSEEALLDDVPTAVSQALGSLTGNAGAPSSAATSTTEAGSDTAASASAEPGAAAETSVLSWSVLGAGAVVMGGAAVLVLAAGLIAGASELALQDTSGAVGSSKSTLLLVGRGALGAVALGAVLVVVGGATMGASLLIE